MIRPFTVAAALVVAGCALPYEPLDAGTGGGSAAAGGGSATGGGSAGGGGGGGGAEDAGTDGGDGFPDPTGGGAGGGAFDAGPTGTGTVNGPLGFMVRDTRAVVIQYFDGGIDFTHLDVGMSSAALDDFCDGTTTARGKINGLVLGVATGDGGNVVSAVYPVTGNLMHGGVALRFSFYVDAGTPVQLGTPQIADGGTITLTTVGPSGVIGTYNVSFGNTHASGAFDAPWLPCR